MRWSLLSPLFVLVFAACADVDVHGSARAQRTADDLVVDPAHEPAVRARARRVEGAATREAPVRAQFAAPVGQNRILTLVRAGSERGIVSVAALGLACKSRRCAYSIPEGSRVVITAEAFSGGAFSGWSGVPGCTGIGPCVLDLRQDTTVTAIFTGGPNIAFMSSRPVPAALGGLAGADAVCQTMASSAGLPGSYVAWLSTSSQAAIGRLAGARGWVRPDGKVFVDTLDDLRRSNTYYPLRIDENGSDRASDARDLAGFLQVWTGTRADGERAATSTCGDWTSLDARESTRVGSAVAIREWFTSADVAQCDAAAHLYCFGVGNSAETVPRIEPGRLAFSTYYEFFPGLGIEEADRQCKREASWAGRTGDFRALLATNTASAASRFNPFRERWVGIDGVPVTARGDSLNTEVPFELPPHRTVFGGQNAGRSWIGARSLREVGTDEQTCGDWRLMTGTGRGGITLLTSAPIFMHDQLARCEVPETDPARFLICLEN